MNFGRKLHICAPVKMLWFAMLFIVLQACNKAPEVDNAVNENQNFAAAPPEVKTENDADRKNSDENPMQMPAEKKLVKNGNIRMQVDDYRKFRQQLNAIIAGRKAYVGNENEGNTGSLLENNMVIRVPSANFDMLVADIEKQAKYIESKNISVEDVTAQYVDIEARLKTKREVEKRYTDLLSRAKNIEEILKVEEQIRILREEIESAEGQLKLMRDQVQYSTLNLYFYQQLPYKPEPAPRMSFFTKLWSAIANGWFGLLNFFVAIMHLWPVWLILAFVLWLIRSKFGSKKDTSAEK